MDLFSNNDTNTAIPLTMAGADVIYHPNLLSTDEGNELLQKLMNTVTWRQDQITVYGKTHPQPRLTALFANNDIPYSYSNIKMQPKPFTKELFALKEKVKQYTNTKFTTCLLNYYRDGQDSNGWHADDEKELGKNPVIASISLGTDRWFHFKHRTDKNLKYKILLQHGSLLLMQGKTQENWLHQIPKSKKINTPRINITFRTINP